MSKKKQAPRVGETTTDNGFLGRRDAFHFPGILVKSRLSCSPGTWVEFIKADLSEVLPARGGGDNHAVVDPFIDTPKPGTLFYVFPKPETINSLTHHFNMDLEVKDMPESNSDVEEDKWGEPSEPTIESRVAEEEKWIEDEEQANECRGCY